MPSSDGETFEYAIGGLHQATPFTIYEDPRYAAAVSLAFQLGALKKPSFMCGWERTFEICQSETKFCTENLGQIQSMGIIRVYHICGNDSLTELEACCGFPTHFLSSPICTAAAQTES